MPLSSEVDGREDFQIRALMQEYVTETNSWQPVSMLLVMPKEIREMVYTQMSDDDDDFVADVTMKPPRSGRGRTMRLQYLFPQMITTYQSLLSIPKLEEEVQEYIAKNVLFRGQHSSGFLDMPAVFGPDNCQLIHRFEMRVEFFFKLKHQGQWPDFLTCFVQDLPNLQWLKLYSRWSDRSQPHPEVESKDPAGTMTRFDQNVRSAFRFLCWLNKRHYNFQDKGRLILPAETGGRFGQEDVYSHFLVLETYRERRTWKSVTESIGPIIDDDEEDKREFRTVYDEVLNTKLGRRVQWQEWHNNGVTLENFIIHPVEGESRNSIVASEVGDDDDKYFERLEERGYQPYQLFEDKNWRKTGPAMVDGLISQGRSFKKSVVERAQQEASVNAGSNNTNDADRGRGRGRDRGRGRGRGFGRGQGLGRGRPVQGLDHGQANGGFRGNARGLPFRQGRGGVRGAGRG
ncbi:hypothetical protein LTR05_007373 [Lithohypha guttulata]|uniref:Uncharacterized protein n=1 Tax=Lithohypha guttulata TaxID=1690604 RepID=A0AAN7SUZ4_9EURO|nr:hypothetical protein LTR05_007373 [Lithohypha guttulata]